MIADSVAFCRGAGQAGGLRRRALLRRLPRRPGLRARMRARRGRGRGRERHPLRHQRRQPARLRRRGDRGRRRRARRRRSRSASTPTTTPSARSPTRSPRSTPGPGWSRARVNGYGERCGNANLASILPALQLKMGFEVRLRRAAGEPDRDRPLPRRALQHDPDPDQPYVGRNAFAHKAGMHAAGVAADARTFEHLDPAAGRQRARHPRLRALGQGDDPQPGRAGRARARRRGRRRGRSSGSRSASTAATTTRRRRPPSSCCCGARRAATSRCSSWRASG